jgi:hypothetical protein
MPRDRDAVASHRRPDGRRVQSSTCSRGVYRDVILAESIYAMGAFPIVLGSTGAGNGREMTANAS